MTQLCAYLSYNGNCAEAMRFYAKVLNAKLEALITYGEMPGGDPVPPEHAGRIMHAYLVHPDFAIMAGDAPPGVPFTGIQGCMLAITYPTVAEATRVFKALKSVAVRALLWPRLLRGRIATSNQYSFRRVMASTKPCRSTGFCT